MPAECATAYFDANVILAFVSEEEHRAIVVRELLRQGDQGHRRIYTSTLSIAEVAFGAQKTGRSATRPRPGSTPIPALRSSGSSSTASTRPATTPLKTWLGR